MDTHRSEIHRETIRKEMRMNSRHLEEMRKMRGDKMSTSMSSLPPIKKRSCVDRQLDQTMGLAKNPHVMTNEELSQHAMTADDFFQWGVSHEGQGRHAYLKMKTRAGGPHERYGNPILSSQEVGWATKQYQQFGTSPFARRPLVKNDFYRTMGVSFSTGTL
jgi:hypothetical protein